jgi:hypothetical protein
MWIITTWQHVSPELTVRGFKKSCLSSAVDGTKDDTRLLWNDSEKDGNVRSDSEKTNTLTVELVTVTP